MKSMKSKILVCIAAVLLLVTVDVHSGTVTISGLTNGQDTYIQTVLIPEENARKCAAYSRTHPSPGCVTADLSSPNGSCVAAAMSAVSVDNLSYRDCTIYTQDAAGEALYTADQFFTHTIIQVRADLLTDVTATKAAWTAANTTAKNNACAALGRPNGCHFYE